MSDPVARLNAALEGRYTIERERARLILITGARKRGEPWLMY